MSVAEELKGYQAKLEDIINNLEKLKDQPHNVKTIEKYQHELHQIDKQFQDGKIGAKEGYIPDGQSLIIELLNDAHELASDLLETAEDADD